MKLCIFKGWYIANGSSESNNPAKYDLFDARKFFLQTATDFLLVSAENTKNEPFLWP